MQTIFKLITIIAVLSYHIYSSNLDISGTVSDFKGEGIYGVKVFLLNKSEPVFSDSLGRYNITMTPITINPVLQSESPKIVKNKLWLPINKNSQRVNIDIYNFNGKKLWHNQKDLKRGNHYINIGTENLASQVLIINLNTEDQNFVFKYNSSQPTITYPLGFKKLNSIKYSSRSAVDRNVANTLVFSLNGWYSDTVEISSDSVTYNHTLCKGLKELADSKNLYLGSAYSNFYKTDLYQEHFLRNFNCLTPEDCIDFRKLRPSENEWNFLELDKVMEFAYDNNLPVKAHHLIWNDVVLPEWLLDSSHTKEEITFFMKDFIQGVIKYCKENYPNTVKWWSVVNEVGAYWPVDVFQDNIWYRTLGPSFVDSAFVWAREADSTALLYYNEFYYSGPEWGGQYFPERIDFTYNIIEGLINNGIPIDGVGFQTHLTLSTYPGKSTISNYIKRFTDLNLETYITEMTVSITDSVKTKDLFIQQANVFKDVFEIVLENDKCNSFTVWGFNDKFQWFNSKGYESVLMFEDYSPKPAWYELKKCLLK